jgi:acyl transferase domain-containing protein
MGVGLYHHDRTFTEAMDEVFGLLGAEGTRLRQEWLSGSRHVPWDDATRAQPLLFAVGYALGRTVLSWSVEPAAMLGHSVGEMVAATLAGIFDVRDAVLLLRERVAEAVATPPGGMLAVAAPADDMAPYLPTGSLVSVAAVNAPRQTMLAGPDRELLELERVLHGDGYVCRRAGAHQAFHSPVMTGPAGRTRAGVAAARPRPPRRPMYSGYTGLLLDDQRAVDVDFWARQMAEPVRFWSALEALLGSGPYLLVEAGAGQGLTTLARQHPALRTRVSDAAAMLPLRSGDPAADRRCLAAAKARVRGEAKDR